MKRLFVCILAVAVTAATAVFAAPSENIEYYLPAKNVVFNPQVPSPAQYLGYEVAERFVEWSDMVGYIKAL